MSIKRGFLVVTAGALLAGCDGSAAGGRMIDGGTSPVWVYGSTVSNLPATTFTVTKKEAAADLELLSSNLVPDPDSSVNYIEWFGEVRNNGAVPTCFVEVRINFTTVQGFGVQSIYSFADGEPYQHPALSSEIPCIPPGKTSAVWGNDSPALPPDLSTIAIIEAKLDLSQEEELNPSPTAPALGTMTIIPDPKKGAGFWAIAGSLTAAETIYSIGVTGYPKDAAGLLLSREWTGHSDTLSAGASWAWQTEAYQGPRPASFMVSVDYISGAKP